MSEKKQTTTAETSVTPKQEGWGVENVPNPKGLAIVGPRWELCTGCGICELECAMYHFGVVNRKLSRIKVQKYLLPTPKAIQSVCANCHPDQERECEKACPLTPKVIYFDAEKMHMVVDADRCLGYKCNLCAKACGADVIHFYPPDHDYALVCDLCEKDGVRQPQCVEVCPHNALEFKEAYTSPSVIRGRTPSYYYRINPDENAELWSKRLHPLTKDKVGPW